MRVRVINWNPKMAEEKGLHKTLKSFRKDTSKESGRPQCQHCKHSDGQTQNQPVARKELWTARGLVHGGQEGRRVSAKEEKEEEGTG